jgi:alkylation response protein AidB-like acyl-CoA dehydrogenase
MEFKLNQSQIDIQDLARKFAQKEIAPFVEIDEAQSFFRRDIIARAGEAGLLGITVGEANGGAGLGLQENIVLMEELAAVSSGYATSLSVTAMPAGVLDKVGTPEQKKKYLPKLLNGEHLGAFALTEPGSGSDAAGLKTTARLEGDSYVLNGVKQFITNGIHADIFMVMARTGGEGARGVSAFIVEKDFGLKGGKVEKKMGMRVSPTQEILLENVRVPVANRLGQEGEGFKVALKTLDSGRLSIAAIAIGLARAALDRAIAYAKEREQFGKPLMEFQGIAFPLADHATDLEAARLLVQKAAYLKDTGEAATHSVSMAKLFATEACMRITTDAVQVLGGYGYMEEFQVERYMREAKMLQIVEGTSQIQRRVIARDL